MPFTATNDDVCKSLLLGAFCGGQDCFSFLCFLVVVCRWCFFSNDVLILIVCMWILCKKQFAHRCNFVSAISYGMVDSAGHLVFDSGFICTVFPIQLLLPGDTVFVGVSWCDDCPRNSVAFIRPAVVRFDVAQFLTFSSSSTCRVYKSLPAEQRIISWSIDGYGCENVVISPKRK